jgi:hypothetical protein
MPNSESEDAPRPDRSIDEEWELLHQFGFGYSEIAKMSPEDFASAVDHVLHTQAQAQESETDSIVAELSAKDNDAPLSPPSPPPKVYPKESGSWVGTILFICIGAVVYWVFGRNENVEQTTPQPPGWYNLIDCSSTASIDGTKLLDLSDDHQAVMSDVSKDNKSPAVHGTWAFDAATKLYTITLNDVATPYTQLSPQQGDTCILVKGDLGAADLRASWFATPDDQGPDDRD